MGDPRLDATTSELKSDSLSGCTMTAKSATEEPEALADWTFPWFGPVRHPSGVATPPSLEVIPATVHSHRELLFNCCRMAGRPTAPPGRATQHRSSSA